MLVWPQTLATAEPTHGHACVDPEGEGDAVRDTGGLGRQMELVMVSRKDLFGVADHLINETGCGSGYPPRTARRAKTPSLAREGHKLIHTKGRAADSVKAAGQNAAAQGALELLPDRLGNIVPPVGPLLEKRLPVVRNNVLPMSLLGLSAFVCRNSKAHARAMTQPVRSR